jgi:O-antigen/teichoic acid export membrane protein
MKIFARDSVLVFFSEIFSNALKFLTFVIIAKVLGPSGQGVYSIVMQIVAFSVMFGNLGIEISIIYFIGQKKYPVKSIVGNGFAFALLSSLCLVIILFLIDPFLIEKFMKNEHLEIIFVAEIAVVFFLLQAVVSSVVLGQNKIVEWSFLKIINSFILILLVIILLRVIKLDIIGSIIAYVVASLCTLLIGFYLLYRNDSLSLPFFSKDIIRGLISYGLKVYFGTLSQYFNYRLDIFLVAYFLGPSHVGYYSVAVMVGEIIWYIPNSISLILLPRSASSSFERNNELIPIISRNTFFLTLIFSSLIFVGSKFFIPMIFGNSYFPSINSLKLLLPGIVALSLWKIMTNDLAGRGFPQYKSYTAGIALLGTIFFDIILIPKFGINGAAIASSIAYILSTIAMFYWFGKITGLKIYNLLIPSKKDIKIYKALIIRK